MNEPQKTTVAFTVYGDPQGKARARTVKGRDGKTHSYTPDKTTEYEHQVRMCYRSVKPVFFQGAVAIKIIAGFPIPKSVTQKVRAQILCGELQPTKKPDCDNIAKIICDALNGVAYKDDAQITRLVVDKRYTTSKPCVQVFIEGVKEE